MIYIIYINREAEQPNIQSECPSVCLQQTMINVLFQGVVSWLNGASIYFQDRGLNLFGEDSPYQ